MAATIERQLSLLDIDISAEKEYCIEEFKAPSNGYRNPMVVAASQGHKNDHPWWGINQMCPSFC